MLFNGRWIFRLKAIHLKLLNRAMLSEALKSQESRTVLAIRDEETHWY